MKINEQLALTTRHTSQNKQQDQLDFEQWITSPMKQNSGDEYYWQHQEQLEQSSLRFEPQPLVHQQKKPEQSISSEATIDTPTVTPSADSPVQQNCISFQPEKNCVKQSNAEVQFSINIESEPELFKNSLPAIEQSAPTKNDLSIQTKEMINPDLPQFNQYPFKNHHLFIKDEQAELTLNTKDLNHKEQKELTQLMKQHLKNKGLNLNKLIINGVQHD
jgi:hypothetical protein